MQQHGSWWDGMTLAAARQLQIQQRHPHPAPSSPALDLPQEKRSYLAEAEEQQQGAALLVLRRFVDVLAAGHGTAEGDAMDAGAAGDGPWQRGLSGPACCVMRWPASQHAMSLPAVPLAPALPTTPQPPTICPLAPPCHTAHHLPPRPTPPSPPDADEATALQDFMLAALKSFVRRYNVQCAQLAERIGAEVLGGEGVPRELREAVETQLNL